MFANLITERGLRMDSQKGGDNESTFGAFVKMRREALGKSLRGFAEEIEIAAPYLFDIEKGNRPAPEKKLERFIEALGFTGDELNEFYDLAGKSRKNHFPDLQDYIGNTELARVALRTARDVDLSNSQWQEIINQMKNPSDSK
jgi:transcriptional regulator with XRE-family HTH domain